MLFKAKDNEVIFYCNHIQDVSEQIFLVRMYFLDFHIS